MKTCITPFEKALGVYKAHPGLFTFDEALTWHLLKGFVFSRPDLFVMGRAVVSTATPQEIGDLSHSFHSTDCDCWFVYLFSGNVVTLYDLMPWPLPKIGFARRGEKELLFFDLERIRSKSLGVSTYEPSAESILA